jgi:hypothetical protein
MQQIDCNPQFRLRELSAPVRKDLFLFEFRNLVREPRHFSARRIAMHDALLRRANQSRFGFRHRRSCLAAIASSNRLLDLTQRGAHARTPRFIDNGSARALAGGFLCGFRVGHTCGTQEMVTGSGAYRVLARYRQRRRPKAGQGDGGKAARYPACGSGDALGAYRVIAGNCGRALGGRVAEQGRLDARPLRVAADVGEQRFYPRHQGLAVE